RAKDVRSVSATDLLMLAVWGAARPGATNLGWRPCGGGAAAQNCGMAPLSLREQLLDVGFEVCAIHDACVGGGDVAFPVDKERVGHIFDLVALRGGLVAEDDAIGDLRGGEEGLQSVPAIVHRNADYTQSFAAAFAVELGEPGDFFFAPVAPGGPEIEQHDFAPEFLEVDGFAAAVLEREHGRGLALFARLELSRHVGLCGGGERGQKDKSELHATLLVPMPRQHGSMTSMALTINGSAR